MNRAPDPDYLNWLVEHSMLHSAQQLAKTYFARENNKIKKTIFRCDVPLLQRIYPRHLYDHQISQSQLLR